MLEVGSIISDRYEVGEKIADGGLGLVHRCYDLRLEAARAIKFIREDLSTVTRSICIERFQREAQAVAQVGAHQNVAAVFDYGELPCHYIVMELVDGETLSAILEREKRLSVERAAKLMKQICSGIGAVHARHIVHRDLKTTNILVTRTSDGEFAKVIDFGIAKLPDSDSGGLWTKYTQVGWSMGTPEYMPPEQWDDASAVGPQSDVYSLGMICYELLAGSLPFHTNNRAEYGKKHRSEIPPPFHKALNVPREVESVVIRALAKDLHERQNNAKELAEELGDAIDRAAQVKQEQEEVSRQQLEAEVRDKIEAKMARLINELKTERRNAETERRNAEAAEYECNALRDKYITAETKIESLISFNSKLQDSLSRVTGWSRATPTLLGLLIGASIAAWLVGGIDTDRWVILSMVIMSFISLTFGVILWWMHQGKAFRAAIRVSIFAVLGFSIATLVFLALGSASIAMLERGNADRNAKHYDKAIVKYTVAAYLNPKNSNPYFDRGLAYYYKDEPDKAIADYDKVMRVNPNAWALFNRGTCYANKGEYDKAIGDYTEALNFTVNQSEVYRSRGLAHHGKKDYDRAIADYNESIRLNPSNASAYLNRGYTFQAVSQKDKAEADFVKARQLKTP